MVVSHFLLDITLVVIESTFSWCLIKGVRRPVQIISLTQVETTNMRVWIVLSTLSLVALLAFADEISDAFSNPQLITKTIECLEDKSPCTKFGEKVKVVIKEIARTGVCRSCSKDEQEKAYVVIKRFRKENPAVYTRLLAKFRPSGVPKDVPAPLKELAGDHPSKPISG